MGAREVLQSWKEIAAYLGRDIRTCRRWEEHLGLPVHRLDGSPKARVMAYKDEIDWWLDAKLHEHDPARAPSGNGPESSSSMAAGPRVLGYRLPGSLAGLRRWYALAAFTAVMAIGVLGWRAINNGRPHYVPDGSLPSIAVLPFVNATGEGGLGYLTESVPDHLIRDLQRNSDRLRVFSFQAVADAVRGLGLEPGAPLTPDDLAAVSDRLGAGWLVVGFLHRSGSRLRVAYAIHEPGAPTPIETDHVLASEGDIGTVEGRVADGVRRAFGVPTEAGPESLALCSVQATRYYEAARALDRKYWPDPSPAVLEQIIALLTKARDADPGCPLAYLGLGDAYQFRFVYEADTAETRRLMEDNYRRAYEMAPERAETNVGLGWVHYFHKDNDQAYACFKKAVTLDPSSLHVLTDVGSFLRSLGMFERAVEYYTRVIQAGGTTADMYLLRGYTYEQMGLFESALADYDRIVSIEPTDHRARCHLARVLILMERPDAAAVALNVAEALKPGDASARTVRALAAAAAGDRKEALAAIAALRDESSPTSGTFTRSRVYAVLGLLDDALDAIVSGIDRGFEDRYDYLYVFPYLNNTRDHFYDKLRRHPRFAGILRLEERKYSANLEKYGGL